MGLKNRQKDMEQEKDRIGRLSCYLADRLRRDFPGKTPDGLEETLRLWLEHDCDTEFLRRHPGDAARFLLELESWLRDSVKYRQVLRETSGDYLSGDQGSEYRQYLEKILAREAKHLVTEHTVADYRIKPGDLSSLIGESASWSLLLDHIRRAASCEATVMLTGEAGTGKRLAARAIHDTGSRAKREFVVLPCSALTRSDMTGMLKQGWNHIPETGKSFSGDSVRIPGLVQSAAGGTLLLDKVDQLPTELQPLLLDLLEGRNDAGFQALSPPPRIIATSREPLEDLVTSDKFYSGLFYRLNLFRISIPPLRERPEDIELLVNHFVPRIIAHSSLPKAVITLGAIEKMKQYAWPGNVRELEYVLERSILQANNWQLQAAHIRFESPPGIPPRRKADSSHVQKIIDLFMENGVQFNRVLPDDVAHFLLERNGIHFMSREFAAELGLSIPTSRSILSRLCKARIIEKHGKTKAMVYRFRRPADRLA